MIKNNYYHTRQNDYFYYAVPSDHYKIKKTDEKTFINKSISPVPLDNHR